MTPTPDPTPTAPASAERMVLVSESVLRAAGWRTLREWHEEAAGYGLAEFFFRMTGINPDEWGPPALAQPQPAAAAVADGLRALALDWRTEAHHTDDHQDEAWTAINNTLRRCADDVLALLAPQAQAEAGAQSGVKWPVTSDICLVGRDGDCNWPQCPQERDGEPHATGRHCPLDNRTEEGS